MELEEVFWIGPRQFEVKPAWREEWEYTVISPLALQLAGYSEDNIEPLPQCFNWRNIYRDMENDLTWTGNSSGPREVGLMIIHVQNLYIVRTQLLAFVVGNCPGLTLTLNGKARERLFGQWSTKPRQYLEAPLEPPLEVRTVTPPREELTAAVALLPVEHTLTEETWTTISLREPLPVEHSLTEETWTTVSLTEPINSKRRRRKCPRCRSRRHPVRLCPLPRRVIRNQEQGNIHCIQFKYQP